MPFGLRKISQLSRLRRFCRRHTSMLQLAAILGASIALQATLKLKWYLYPFNLLAFYLASGGWRFARLMWLTLGRDIRAFSVLIKVLRYFKKHGNAGHTVADIFRETSLKYPNHPALINAETGATMTFQEVESIANRIAYVFKQNGYKQNDCVAIMMDGCPEYVCYWLGLSKIGVVSSLLNYSLRGDSLLHCIKIVDAKGIIYGHAYKDAVEDIKDRLPSDTEYYNADEADESLMTHNLKDLLSSAPDTLVQKPPGLNFNDKVLYIYTSGTTGLPKAATLRHSRCIYLGNSLGTGFNTGPKDIGYISLPLYHSNGGLVGIGNCLFRGMTCVIRKKFSASRFVEDCVKYDVTLFFYIGEICRYLLSQPRKEEEDKLRIRVCIGNGLRPQIWREFQSRFHIKLIGEFYGATETNSGMINLDGTEGAVGFTSVLLPKVFPLTLVRVDPHTGEIIRGSNGLAIECQAGEPGELVGKINNADPLRRFDGYVDKEATKKKLGHDILQKGDTVFLSGDILVRDELGYFYFRDRSGDTFRWKGENVSTTEVETTISKIINLMDVVAYGVEVPGTEGKAGMVTIADNHGSLDLEDLAIQLKVKLPAYARPIFLRISNGVNCTGTFKFQKSDLRKEGFHISRVGSDRLYFLNTATGKYEVIDWELYDKIMKQKLRF